MINVHVKTEIKTRNISNGRNKLVITVERPSRQWQCSENDMIKFNLESNYLSIAAYSDL